MVLRKRAPMYRAEASKFLLCRSATDKNVDTVTVLISNLLFVGLLSFHFTL